MSTKHEIAAFLIIVSCILSGCASSTVGVRSQPDESRGLSRETGRAFLIDTQTETPGYGLYSYLLFGSRPTNDLERKRYLEAITNYVNAMDDIAGLGKYIRPKELNVTYVPLDLPPPLDPTPQWILKHYNYSRARLLLRIFQRQLRSGPYIISTLKPLSFLKVPPDKYLFQDLSTVPPSVISIWVREFISQAGKERFWEENTLSHFVVVFRTDIAMFSKGLSEVQKSALQDMIILVENR